MKGWLHRQIELEVREEEVGGGNAREKEGWRTIHIGGVRGGGNVFAKLTNIMSSTLTRSSCTENSTKRVSWYALTSAWLTLISGAVSSALIASV